jgi:hypothetical protein
VNYGIFRALSRQAAWGKRPRTDLWASGGNCSGYLCLPKGCSCDDMSQLQAFAEDG